LAVNVIDAFYLGVLAVPYLRKGSFFVLRYQLRYLSE